MAEISVGAKYLSPNLIIEHLSPNSIVEDIVEAKNLSP
jgi:hypothetical protein